MAIGKEVAYALLRIWQEACGGHFGELFAPRYFRVTCALPALLVFRAAGIAIVCEAHGVGFERAEDIVRSAKFAGFEAHSIPNLAIAFPPFRGSIFPIGGLLVHGFPCFLSCWTKVHSAEGVKGGGFAPCISPLTQLQWKIQQDRRRWRASKDGA